MRGAAGDLSVGNVLRNGVSTHVEIPTGKPVPLAVRIGGVQARSGIVAEKEVVEGSGRIGVFSTAVPVRLAAPLTS